MNLIDLFIIYLACGAPFGVYYYLQNRMKTDSVSLWLKTAINFLFWIPFTLLLLRRNKNLKLHLNRFGKISPAEAMQIEVLFSIKKQLEQFLPESDLKISVYEFREIVERYVGLTLGNSIGTSKISEPEKEIFRVSTTNNVELGAICFARRNRKRLLSHQTEARKDFLHLIKNLFDGSSDKAALKQSAIELVNNLNDIEARKSLAEIFADSGQSDGRLNVKRLEKNLWKPELNKPLHIKPTSILLQTMETTSLHKKD